MTLSAEQILELLGRKVVFKEDGRVGTLETTTEPSLIMQTPYCICKEGYGALIYFGEGVVRNAYSGESKIFCFVDNRGDKITNFLDKDFLDKEKERRVLIERYSNLIGKVVFLKKDKMKGKIELTRHPSYDSNYPFLIKDENGKLWGYFGELFLQKAYEGTSVDVYFIDEEGEKITNFLEE